MSLSARFLGWLRKEWPSLGVVALAVLAQLVLVARPFDFYLTNLLTDDAFYYFQIARHIAEGLGSTFDGITPTNGYHPLWLVILVGIYKWFSAGGAELELPIRAALYLSLAFNAATWLLAARVIARVPMAAYLRAIALFIFACNPFLLYQTLNGLETSLALMVFALFTLFAVRFEEGKGSAWALGIVAGAMTLARLDMGLYAFAFLVWLMWTRGWSASRKDALTFVLVAGATAAPWFLWNLVQFHTLLTSSSLSETLVNHQLIVQDHGASIAQFLKAVLYFSQRALEDVFERTGMYALACALFGAALALLCARALPLPRTRKEIPVLAALFGGFVLLFIGNASVRWTMREWYFVSFGLFLALLCANVLARVFAHITYKKSAALVFFAAVFFSFTVDWSKALRGGDQSPLDMRAAAIWQSEHLPPGTRVGAFNSGIQGYFSKAQVINLDGLVNNAAYDALREKRLWAYIHEARIAYLIDFPFYLTYRYKSFLGTDTPQSDLTLVTTIGSSSLSVWRVK